MKTKLSNGLACDLTRTVTAHRKPTASEIKFGYGATHYRDFPLADFYDAKGNRIKARIKAPDDGLIYSIR